MLQEPVKNVAHFYIMLLKFCATSAGIEHGYSGFMGISDLSIKSI